MEGDGDFLGGTLHQLVTSKISSKWVAVVGVLVLPSMVCLPLAERSTHAGSMV